MAVDVDLEEVTRELARALAAPAVGRLIASGASAVAVADALRRLDALGAHDEGRVVLAERLLAEWRARLAAARAVQGARARGAWLGVAGVALALSAVAGEQAAEPMGADRGEVLAAAMLAHAVGVLHVRVELGRLLADPLGDLEDRRVRAAGLVRAAAGAIGGSREAWLWLELEEASARGAAAAVVVALEVV